MPNREKAMGASELVQAIRSRNKDKWALSRAAATRLIQANYDMRSAQRDCALEAVEKLREALSGLYHATCEADFPSIPDKYYHHVLNAQEALASTEPATVDLPKCDRCGAIACGTACDGSSHYTQDDRRFEKRSDVTTDVDK